MELKDLKYYYSSRTEKIHIQESYKVSKKYFKPLIKALREVYAKPFLKVAVFDNRSDRSLVLEWAAHNLLYKLGIARDHTADLGLEWPQKWYLKLGYWIVGNLGMIFLK